nr:crocetin glucosyltransferase, chloroplastic-like [Tanacetum cinerariifolium]
SHQESATVPANSTVYYDVELVSFEKEKDSWELTTPEKIETCGRKKEEGNIIFKKQKYEMASKRYKKVQVLSHAAIGCFVTHCGWNSITESVVSGIPMVGYPKFADQILSVKMVEEVWGNGVKAVADNGGVVTRDEIKRCLNVVMDDGEIKSKKNEILKGLAQEANVEGGSSHTNLKQLLENSM